MNLQERFLQANDAVRLLRYSIIDRNIGIYIYIDDL